MNLANFKLKLQKKQVYKKVEKQKLRLMKSLVDGSLVEDQKVYGQGARNFLERHPHEIGGGTSH